jgi:hypothetical protein
VLVWRARYEAVGSTRLPYELWGIRVDLQFRAKQTAMSDRGTTSTIRSCARRAVTPDTASAHIIGKTGGLLEDIQAGLDPPCLRQRGCRGLEDTTSDALALLS